MAKTSKLSSAFKILWEALNIIRKSWRTLLPILLINLLLSAFLLLLNLLSITPAITQLAAILASLLITHAKTPEYAAMLSAIRTNIRQITTIEAIFLASYFILSSFITTTTIHLISTARSDKKQTPGELFSSIKTRWKGPMMTQLLATTVNISVSFSLLIFAAAFITISIGSIGYTVAAVPLGIAAAVVFLYVALICALGVVVSVVEEGCHGLAAFARAAELVEGRRGMGMVIVFVTAAGSGVIVMSYDLWMIYLSSMFLLDWGLVLVMWRRWWWWLL